MSEILSGVYKIMLVRNGCIIYIYIGHTICAIKTYTIHIKVELGHSHFSLGNHNVDGVRY